MKCSVNRTENTAFGEGLLCTLLNRTGNTAFGEGLLCSLLNRTGNTAFGEGLPCTLLNSRKKRFPVNLTVNCVCVTLLAQS
jgi:hypothetical protein